MTTQEVPANINNDALRASWFAEAGYSGTPGETVELRSDLGTATTDDVWQVLCGLHQLRENFNNQFERTVASAHGDRRPVDPANRLTEDLYGALTDYYTATWRPGRRQIVVALTTLDPDYNIDFEPYPLAPHTGTGKAA